MGKEGKKRGGEMGEYSENRRETKGKRDRTRSRVYLFLFHRVSTGLACNDNYTTTPTTTVTP